MQGLRIFQSIAAGLTLAAMWYYLPAKVEEFGGTVFEPYSTAQLHLTAAEAIVQNNASQYYDVFVSTYMSLVFPYLLAAVLWLGAGDWAILYLTGFGSALTAWLMAGALWRYGVTPSSIPSLFFAAIVLVPMLLAVNILGLAFDGSANALHAAMAVAVVIGIFQLDYDRRMSAWFVIAAILVPLLRDEGIALAVVTLVALLWYHRFRWAVFYVIAVIGSFAGLIWQQLAMGDIDQETAWQLLPQFGQPDLDISSDLYLVIFGLIAAMLAFAAAVRGPGQSARVFVAGGVILTLIAHLSAFDFSTLAVDRTYTLAIMITALILVNSAYWLGQTTGHVLKTAGALCFLAVLYNGYSI